MVFGFLTDRQFAKHEIQPLICRDKQSRFQDRYRVPSRSIRLPFPTLRLRERGRHSSVVALS